MDNNIDKIVFEEKYTEPELAKGILFLLKDYYVGSFKEADDKIYMDFENGQKFVLTLKERRDS